MTEDLNTQTMAAVQARGYSSFGYGKAPVVAIGVISALLVPALVTGGVGVANAITANNAAASAQPSQAPPTPEPGASAPGADDPVTPPDRDSDQTQVLPEKDEIYYVEGGDTLTTLSAKFGMGVDYIADYNAVRDVDVISEGSALRVPVPYKPPASKKPPAAGHRGD